MADITPGVPYDVQLSPNHGDLRSKTLGVFLHSTHGPLKRNPGESLETWYERDYLSSVAFMKKTAAEGNTNQVSPTFCVGTKKVTRMVHDEYDPWCQRYPANDLYLAIEMAKPADAAYQKLPFLDFQYTAVADLVARWKIAYPQIPIAHVTSIGAPGLIGHRDVQAGKFDPDDAFDWGRALREANAKYQALVAPPVDRYSGIGSGIAAFLKAHPEYGYPRTDDKLCFWDAQGNEYVWTDGTAQYPLGVLVVYRKYTNQIVVETGWRK